MPNNNPRYLYWDSCVFLSYINKDPRYIKTIDDVIAEQTENKPSIIYASIESIVEVANANSEKENWILDPSIEERITAMWDDLSVIRVIDLFPLIAEDAKGLIRSAIPNMWALKPKDAVHLATARWINQNINPIDEFNTYDERLEKFGPMVGITICNPHVVQYRLDAR